MWTRVKSFFLIGSALVVCPCHLPITLPLVAALLAGTALGAFLLNNVWLVVAISAVYFVGALALGLRYLSQNDKTCQIADDKKGELRNGKSI